MTLLPRTLSAVSPKAVSLGRWQSRMTPSFLMEKTKWDTELSSARTLRSVQGINSALPAAGFPPAALVPVPERADKGVLDRLAPPPRSSGGSLGSEGITTLKAVTCGQGLSLPREIGSFRWVIEPILSDFQLLMVKAAVNRCGGSSYRWAKKCKFFALGIDSTGQP